MQPAATNLNDKIAQIERVKTIAQARQERKKSQEAIDKLAAEIDRKMREHRRNLAYMDFNRYRSRMPHLLQVKTRSEKERLAMTEYRAKEKRLNEKMVSSFSRAVDKAMSVNAVSNDRMVNIMMRIGDYMIGVILAVILAFHIINAKEGFEVIKLSKSIFNTLLIYSVLKIFITAIL